jgi:hypothetical protein
MVSKPSRSGLVNGVIRLIVQSLRSSDFFAP